MCFHSVPKHPTVPDESIIPLLVTLHPPVSAVCENIRVAADTVPMCKGALSGRECVCVCVATLRFSVIALLNAAVRDRHARAATSSVCVLLLKGQTHTEPLSSFTCTFIHSGLLHIIMFFFSPPPQVIVCLEYFNAFYLFSSSLTTVSSGKKDSMQMMQHFSVLSFIIVCLYSLKTDRHLHFMTFTANTHRNLPYLI